LLILARVIIGICFTGIYRFPIDVLLRIWLLTPPVVTHIVIATKLRPRRWIVVLFWSAFFIWNFACYVGGVWVRISSAWSIGLALLKAWLHG
jgi:hypothetical protein